MSLRAAIFDMDGLLFDTEHLFLTYSKVAKDEMGFSIPEELHIETIGRTVEDTRKIFLEYLGQDFPLDTFLVRTKELVDEHVERYGMPVKPGAVELLRELRRYGVMIILASSSPVCSIEENLAVANMRSFFDLIVSGEEVEHGKPAPDIFLLAAERGGVAPEECLVFEDSNNGALAGCAAGMRTVMVPDVKPPTPQVRGRVYKIFSALPPQLYELWW